MVEKRRLALYGEKEIEEAVPCQCRLQDMVEEWLSPITRLLSQSSDWIRSVRSRIDSTVLKEIRPDRNVLIEASKLGGILWVKEALKAHLLSAGWQNMTPFRVTSEQEIDDFNFSRQGDYAKLKGFSWSDYKLFIITLGYLPKSALVRYLAPRLNSMGMMGIRIWLIYHHDKPPVVDPENYCWSREMSFLTSDWLKMKLLSPFSRGGKDYISFADKAIDLSASRSPQISSPPFGEDPTTMFGPNG